MREDQAKVSRRQINLEAVIFSAEQEVTVPASIKIPDSTQYLLQPVLTLPKEKITISQAPGKIRVQGQLEGILSCVDSGEQVRSLALPALDFVAAFSVPALNPEVKLQAEVRIDGTEVDLSESHGANVTVYLIINLWVSQTQEVEIVAAAGGGGLQVKTGNVRLQHIIKEISAPQTIELHLLEGQGLVPAATELCLGNLRWQVEAGKLSAEGLVLVKVYCLTTEGHVRVVPGEQAFTLDLDFAAGEVSECSLAYSFEKVSLTPGVAGLNLEIVLKAIATGYREQVTEYVSGLTGADSQLKMIRLKNRIGEGEFKVTIEGDCAFTGQTPTCDLVLPRVRIIESQALEGKILVRGLLTLNLFYTDEAGLNRVLVQEEEFSQFFDIEGSMRGYTVKPWAWPGTPLCAEGRYSAPVLIRVEVLEEVEFTAITDVHIVDPTMAPVNASIILYVVRRGDNLFSVARKFNTTQEMLWEYNGLTEGDDLEPGQKILIPVYQAKIQS